jgi:hypothetical protein
VKEKEKYLVSKKTGATWCGIVWLRAHSASFHSAFFSHHRSSSRLQPNITNLSYLIAP